MSPSVINYPWVMARWQPDARGRLQLAALTLYGEQGFDSTTVAEIAERAGLTKRTFFRYFADKREVLFYGARELQERFVEAVAQAPESAGPLEAVTAALDAAARYFQEMGREYPARRQQVIAANPELQERELIKLSSLAGAVAQALRERGVGEPTAILTAEAGITVFRVAFEHWVDPAGEKDLQQHIHESLQELRTVASA